MISVVLGEKNYPIVIERGAIVRIGEYVGKNRRVCVVSDSGVPQIHVSRVVTCLRSNDCDTMTYIFPSGEKHKSMDTFLALQKRLLDAQFSRRDAIIAVGGGVVGDLAGFVAATYMRGIDFFNVPTTVLSQVDSSVGGKTAVDFCGYKNMVGAFYQPRAVVIDPDVLLTLPLRQVANGLAEALKMGLTLDAELFNALEGLKLPRHSDGNLLSDIADDAILLRMTDIITKSIIAKRDVVQQDETETGFRQVLNFGHTIGHAVESCADLGALYHGECVAIGMLPMCSETLQPRVARVLKQLGLPTEVPSSVPVHTLLEAIRHDKKADHGAVHVVCCHEIGSFLFDWAAPEELIRKTNITGNPDDKQLS